MKLQSHVLIYSYLSLGEAGQLFCKCVCVTQSHEEVNSF